MDRDEILGLGKEKGWEKRIDVGHNSQHFEGHLTYLDRDPEFHLNTGYYGGRNNVRGFDGHFTYMKAMEFLRLHDAHFNFFFAFFDDKDAGRLNFDYFRQNTSIFYKFLGFWFANGFDGQWSRERVGDQVYDNWQAYVSIIYNYASFENTGLRVKRGESFGARADILEAWLRFKPLGFLSLDFFTNRVAFAGHQNEIGWPDQWVSILKSRLDVAGNIYLRTFLQINDTHGWRFLRDVNLLFAWEFKRRNVLYVAFNHDEGWDDVSEQREASRKVLIKMSFFWGI